MSTAILVTNTIVLEAFREYSAYSSAEFIRHCGKKFPFAIKCVHIDNGSEFTNCLNPSGTYKQIVFKIALAQMEIQHKLIRPYTPEFYVSQKFFSFITFKSNSLLGSVNTTTSRSVPLRLHLILSHIIDKSTLTELNIFQSMSRKGEPYGNAIVENFFSCIKCERDHLSHKTSRR